MDQEDARVFYDFDLIIRASSVGYYSVTMLNEAGKNVGEQVFQHFDNLRNVPVALKKATSTDPKDTPSMYGKLKDFGEKLYKGILADKIGRELRRLIDVGGIVALRLRIEPPELKNVPWETFFDGSEFLATSAGMVISRIPPGIAKSDKPVVETIPNLICLFMRPLLEVYGEETRWEKRKKAFQAALGKVTAPGDVSLTVEEVATLEEVREVLAGDKYEIVHLFCQSEDDQVLLAEGELISATALSQELTTLKNLRLAVFSCVWRNNVAVEEMGRNVVAGKVPGVLVMPFEMGLAQEKAFLETFYHAVVKGCRLDHAVLQARKACLAAGEPRSDFVLPMFFMSLSGPFKPSESMRPKESTLATLLHDLIEKEQGAKKAMAVVCLAYLQQQEGEYDAALENYALAIPLFEESKDLYNLAVTLNNVATIHIERKEYEKAHNSLRRCIELRKELDLKDEAAIAHSKLAYCYLKLKKLQESIENYNVALEINQQIQDIPATCGSYFNLGIACKAKGDLEAAIEMFQRSVERARELHDDLYVADALEYLGTVCLDSEDFNHAKKSLDQCVEIYSKMGDKTGQAVTLNNLGNVELRLGNLDIARKHFEEALQIFEETGAKEFSIASSIHNLAHVLSKQGLFPEAVFCALRAKDIAARSSIGDIERMSQALLEHIKNEISPDKYAECLGKAEKKLRELTRPEEG